MKKFVLFSVAAAALIAGPAAAQPQRGADRVIEPRPRRKPPSARCSRGSTPIATASSPKPSPIRRAPRPRPEHAARGVRQGQTASAVRPPSRARRRRQRRHQPRRVHRSARAG